MSSYKWAHAIELEAPEARRARPPWATGVAMVLYYKPGCPYCRAVRSDWDKFAQIVRAAGVTVYAVNLDRYPQYRVGFRTVPSMFLYKYGKVEQYPGDGARDWQSMCVWLCSRLGGSKPGFCPATL